MSNFKIHPSFQLNGEVFSTPLELITYSEEVSEELYWFLQEWFSDSETLIVKTSGSTGTPKLVAIKKEFMQNSANATGAFFDLKKETKALCCLSTTYIAGKMMVIRALTLGWHLDVVEPVSNPLEEVFEAYDFCAMVPMQVKVSLWDLHLVKKLLIGGGVVSQGLQDALQGLSTQCFASYGMTETVTHIAVKKLNHITNFISTPIDDQGEEMDSKGSQEANLKNNDLRAESRSDDQVLPISTTSISTPLDDQGEEMDSKGNREASLNNNGLRAESRSGDEVLPISTTSILTPLDDQGEEMDSKGNREADLKNNGLRAESRSKYQLLPNITISKDERDCLVINAPLLSDEKVITNDIVKLHSDTEFEWLGRFDNVINSGGVKLHPEQIEKEISKVITQRFFVAGIADEVLGEKLILIVEGTKQDVDLSCLNLTKFEFPKEILFINQFIETETNKIQRIKTLKLLN